VRLSKRVLLYALVAVLAAAGIAFFEIRFNPTSLIYFTLGWVVGVSILLWVGNRLITKAFNRLLPWAVYGNVRFFIHLLSGIGYSLVVINATYAALKYTLTIDPPTRGQLIVMNVYGAAIFIPVFSLYFSLHFLRSWRKSEIESEKFQKESMRAQLESLKGHLDPHFLFNSLNILSSLIDKDRERSKTFLQKFAEVYRLMLRSKSEDLITLREEMDFIESYSFLLQTRFGESIVFSTNVPASLYASMLPPLTIQMLVENAIKHNVITEKKPLQIAITGDTEWITVSNTLNERGPDTESKRGSGLENIRMRYRHFTSKVLKIEKSATDFSVTIPLLEINTA